MQKLKRSINMGFRVTAEEQAQIMNRMNEIGFPSLRSYLLKMALNGHIITLDLADVRECSRLLRIVSNNVNQLARKANSGSPRNEVSWGESGGGSVYATDITDIRERLDGIWEQQEKIVKNLTKILEAA